jgi:hypothetical protein
MEAEGRERQMPAVTLVPRPPIGAGLPRRLQQLPHHDSPFRELNCDFTSDSGLLPSPPRMTADAVLST